MTILTVGVGEEYSTVAAAVAATQDGDTVKVDAGLYVNDFFTISHSITLESVGGQATLQATVSPPNGKAIVTVDASATIDGFGFTGAQVGDNNGAGIRYEGGNLVVNNSVFWDNQDGLLSAPSPTGTILIENSEFSHNGAGDGYTHNLYVGAIASLTVENSYFHDAVVGHEIKSRALSTTIINNRIEDNAGDGSYSIDLPNGGNALIEGNTIEKGADAQNYKTIAYGEEGSLAANSKLVVTDNTIVNDNPNGILLWNGTPSTPVTLSGNNLFGYAPANVALGTVTQSDNTVLATRPTLDTSSLAPAIVPPAPPPPVIAVPGNTTIQTWGRDGAVIASGHVLTVGKGGEFSTLQGALVASVDGDTIEVAAGTYVNDFGAVNHKVIIEGVGGIAHFVQQGTPGAPNGILTVNADATIKNLEFSGAHNYDGHAAGIIVTAGNVTIDNTILDGNNIGLRALANQAETVSVYDSEIGPNGNPDKGTHNVDIDPIGSFTIQDSYVHGATTGHEIYDRAFNSDIENNRIMDGDAAESSFLLDLGQGGDAVVANNVFAKGAAAVNDILIDVGGEGTPYSNSNVRIDNNTLVSNMHNPDHPYTFFIVAPQAANLLPVEASGNAFQGGIAGSQEFIGVSGAMDSTVVSGTVLNTSAPWSAASVPALFVPQPAGTNALTITATETASDANAIFDVVVDGVTVGDARVTADTATGTPQTFTFTGDWAPGTHAIKIEGVNLRWQAGPSASTLNIDTITLDGKTVGPYAQLSGAGALSYATTIDNTPAAVAASTPTGGANTQTLTLNLSEDAYKGDAQFIVTLDGVQIDDPQNVTALHGQGLSEAFTYSVAAAAGAHKVAVSFINDAYGGAAGDRNLYVDKVVLGGVEAAGDQAPLYGNGSVGFNVTVPAPTPAPTGTSTNTGATTAATTGTTTSTTTAATTDTITGTTTGTTTAATTAATTGTTSATASQTVAAPASHDTLVLQLSEDSFAGDAQFTVTVDGTQLGAAQSVTALHSLGHTQSFTFDGQFGAGAHTVGVSFTNDAYAGAGMDRNLYVNSVSMDGVESAGDQANLYSNGTATFHSTVAPAATGPDTLVVHLSEDMFAGDAQFVVSIDGKQLAGAQSVTASHAQGQSEAFTFNGNFGPGTHDFAVSFLNDTYAGHTQDRNLYVDSVQLNGNQYGAPTPLYTTSTTHFTIGLPHA